jgi:hypothetical protein
VTEFQPAQPGLYVFVASYDGNNPNTLKVDATPCADQPTNEQVTVRTIPTEIGTTPSYFPNDSATITSLVSGNNLPSTGTVTFTLYGAAGGNTALQNCTAGGATGNVYTSGALSTGAAGHTQTAATSNTTFSVDSTGIYYWLVQYSPNDSAHTGSQSKCVESINATLTGDPNSTTVYP